MEAQYISDCCHSEACRVQEEQLHVKRKPAGRRVRSALRINVNVKCMLEIAALIPFKFPAEMPTSYG